MPRKKKRNKKKCRHPCECGWRVRWTAEFRRVAQSLGIWRSTRQELRDLDRRIRNEKTRDQVLGELLAEPIVVEIYVKRLGKKFPARRRYFGKKTARGLYIVRFNICRIWFVTILPRTNSTYKHRKVRVK